MTAHPLPPHVLETARRIDEPFEVEPVHASWLARHHDLVAMAACVAIWAAWAIATANL